MGGRFGKQRTAANDPFYNAVPPQPPFQAGNDPSGGLGAYGPYEEYGYEPTQSLENLYGGPIKPRPNAYGGRYAQGFNQMPGVAPWNYGNYYLGNTTMQMMPLMLNKVHQYGQIQAMAALGNAGLLGSAPMMQNMPIMPCCMPSLFSMPMATPMMAAATPLPVAFNPLVQGMYPMASMNPVNWMTPSSFMSALSSGPMPYRPPGLDFPNNVGMVMTIPYGTPNPLLSSRSFGGGGFSWDCCCYSMPSATVPTPPTISYYPRPISVPQPYPVPYPAPVAIPNIQQVPVPRPVSVVAPPIIAGSDYSSPVSAGVPLWPSQGVFTNGGFGRSTVMASNNNSTTPAPINNRSINGSLPVYELTDQSRLLIGQPVTSSLSNLGSNNNKYPGVTPSTIKNTNPLSQIRDTISNRFRHNISSIPSLSRSNYSLAQFQRRSDPVLPPILHGKLISDSGWLPKTSKAQTIPSILSNRRGKRPLSRMKNDGSKLHSSSSGVSFLKRRRRHRSSSSASEYDCAICQEERDKRRLREYYGSSTVSSLLSSPKGSRKRHLSSNESAFSSTIHSPTSFKQDSYKSHRRHPTRIRIKSKTPPPKKSSSPVLLRRSPIQEEQHNETIQEEEEEEVRNEEKKEEEEEVRNEEKKEEEEEVRNEEKKEEEEEVRNEEIKEEEEIKNEEKKEEQLDKNLIDDNDSIAEKSDHYTSKISLRSIDE